MTASVLVEAPVPGGVQERLSLPGFEGKDSVWWGRCLLMVENTGRKTKEKINIAKIKEGVTQYWNSQIFLEVLNFEVELQFRFNLWLPVLGLKQLL